MKCLYTRLFDANDIVIFFLQVWSKIDEFGLKQTK